MLDGGFFAAALSLVGFAPPRDTLRHEPPPLKFDLALIPNVAASRPTTTVSPCQGLELMPVEIPLKNRPKIRTGINPDRVSDINAIRFFIADWLDACGETTTLLDELLKAYAELRQSYPELPEFSKIKLSKLLASQGCIRLQQILPRNGRDERGKRLIKFEIRSRRVALQQRRAA